MKLKEKLAEQFSNEVRHHYGTGVEGVYLAGFEKARDMACAIEASQQFMPPQGNILQNRLQNMGEEQV